MKGRWIETLTWPEAKHLIEAGWPVVVPIGAISKEHGPHLPLNTDFLYARALAERIATALPVLIAPVVSFGYYPAFVRYPASQHLSAATFGALLTEILSKLIDDGARRIAVVNTGVSTEPVLRIVVRDLYARTSVRVRTADIRQLGQATRRLLTQRLGGHADEGETSVMLAVAPDLVRLDRAEEDYGHALAQPESCFYSPTIFQSDPGSGPDYSATGVRGDPRHATAEKGNAILDEMARELIGSLMAEFPEALAEGPA